MLSFDCFLLISSFEAFLLLHHEAHYLCPTALMSGMSTLTGFTTPGEHS